MNLKAFFVASLSSALELDIARPEDILKHVGPDVLAAHLPKPLWARLFTACLGAPRVDAQLVVETIGIPNLCEHVPAVLIWQCISEIGQRSLGNAVIESPSSARSDVERRGASMDEPLVLRPKSVTTPPPPPQPSRSKPLTAPPPEVISRPTPTPAPAPKAVGPSIPTPATSPVAGSGTSQSLADIVAELEADVAREERAATPPASSSSNRVRTPTQQRFRQNQSNSGVGRLAQNNARRPQAAIPSVVAPAGSRPRRGETDVDDVESETAVTKGDDWRNSLAVEEDQLVDWQASEETLTTADGEAIDTRKR